MILLLLIGLSCRVLTAIHEQSDDINLGLAVRKMMRKVQATKV